MSSQNPAPDQDPAYAATAAAIHQALQPGSAPPHPGPLPGPLIAASADFIAVPEDLGQSQARESITILNDMAPLTTDVGEDGAAQPSPPGFWARLFARRPERREKT